MRMKSLVLLIALLCAWTSTSHAQTPAKVEIFYETLSDAGRKFFVDQFRVVLANLSDSIDLHLYPYGNTAFDGTSYTCPHGDTQCEANRVHACLINAEYITPDPAAISKNLVQSYVQKSRKARDVTAPINSQSVTSFVNCFFKNRFALDNVQDLGNRCLPGDAVSDWPGVHFCAVNPPDSDPLLAELAVLTATVATEIQVDGLVVKINDEVRDAAKTNFLGEVCTALDKFDGICEGSTTAPTKVKIAVYYEAFHSDAGNYITKQLSTYYHVLEDFVDIDLIPYGNTLYDSAAGTYNCTNDPQCISNKFQALVVDSYIGKPKNGDPISGENRAINFINCLFSSTLTNVYQSVEACSNEKLEVDDYRYFIDLIRFNDPAAIEVFESMRTKTAAVAANGVLARVPLVTLNGQVDYNAFDDLVQEACAQYNGPVKAGICTKAKVIVLYEALNHKSRTLFLEQLNPVFSSLYNLIDLQLIPAGRAVIAPGHGFVCAGGADQCDAMKLQACALDFFWNDGNNYTDPIRQEVFEFIVCTFKNKRLLGVMASAETCAEQYIEVDAWFTIHGCLADGTANAIFDEYIQETHSIIQNVDNHAIPIVLINGVEVTDLNTIKAQICGLYDDYHAPDYCTYDAAPKVKIQVYYESADELSKYFFTSQFEPWYMYVEEMASIELYPAGNTIEVNYTDGTCDNYDANSVCLANKLQAFVIDRYSLHDDDGDYIDGTLRTAEFLGCYFNHPNFKDNVYLAAESCADEKLPNDEWFDLLITAKSPAGNAIYKGILDTTAAFKTQVNISSFEQLPWVTLDGNLHSKRAADDLLQTVCSQYAGVIKPLECTPVQVQVYYSAINPQSRRFFLDQLIPTFRKLRERVHLELIPYGVVDPNSNITEECSTRDRICTANKLQACAIEKYFNDEVIDNSIQWDGKNQTLSFITCMFKNVGNEEIFTLAEDCANHNINLAEEIMACGRQPEGQGFLEGMRNKTMGQYETMVQAPWIVINGHRSELAQTAFKQAVCDNILGDKPTACFEATPDKVKLQFHYSTVDNNAQSYILNELYPHYRLLEEIIDLDIIPFGLTQINKDEATNQYTLICPNGVNECTANKIHACIYDQYFHLDDDPTSTNEDQREYDHKLMVLEYIKCYFTSGQYPLKPVDAAMQCVEEVFNDDYSTVHECQVAGRGVEILLEFQEKKVNTLLPHLTYTPWMTVNSKHSYSVEHHIQRAVCDAFKGKEKPLDCYQIYDSDPKPVAFIHYEIGDAQSLDFFTNSLDPEVVSDISLLNLVPFGRSTYTATSKTCVNDAECHQYLEHACLIKLYFPIEPVRTLKTIACTFGSQISDPNVVNLCVDQNLGNLVDPWTPIRTCAREGEGDTIMLENAAIVQGLAPHISHVPWVLINGEHNIEAEVGLTSELCGVYYPTDKPEKCRPTLLPINVYYETMNSHVTSFFLTHLYQYSEYLDEIAQFTFIPYGLTTTSGTNFVCPEGDAQCQGNIIHACIFNRFFNLSSVNDEDQYELNRIRTANFLLCYFFQQGSSNDPAYDAEICLDQNFEGDLWRDIHFCFAGPEGQELYREMGRQTAALSPAISSAPIVTVGGQQSANALVSLMEFICDSYGAVRVPICATLPSHAVKVGVYFSSNLAGQKYFIEQLYPFYQEIVPILRNGTSEARLHSIIEPQITAWGNTIYNAADTANPFVCPDGPTECYLNRVFACISYYHGSEPKATLHKMEFALCVFSNEQLFNTPEDVINSCTNRVWIPDPFIEINFCAKINDQANIDIFLRMKDRTENNFPALTYFPSVTIENLHNTDAEVNLLRAACRNYYGYNKPAECDSIVDDTTTTTTPVSTTTPASTTTSDDGSSSSTLPPTTADPGGSGTVPSISISILLATFLLCRFLF